ncbi:NmrA family NAD(P)-binding protein [Aquimarina algiphila]|uniref:NmrA family NAD(P)-binding protein n=1 Tax=Aquimarina algiphila TaxID=2047982 RepID=UPI002491BFDB|nr:NmrA family NAD(P)-binding protein [Aquimarina algiphila]
MKPKILITAANGNTGFPAAKELLTLGFPVRAFVRNANSKKAKELKHLGAEIFIGDMCDIRDVRKALEGIQRTYFVPTYPNILFQGATFATVADELKLEHVVLLTQWLSSHVHPSIYTKEHALVDTIFKRSTSNLTILNPGLFAFPYVMTPHPLTQFGMFPDFGKNAPPSSEDIGLVAAHILKAPKNHVNQIYRITGKELLSAAQMAATIEKVIGRKITVSQLSDKMITKVLKAYKYPKMDISQIPYYINEGRLGTWENNAPTTVVQDIVGKEADDFETIIRKLLVPQSITKQTLKNKLKAIAFMIKAMLTSPLNIKHFEKQQHLPEFKNTLFSSQSKGWRKTHK